MEIGGSKFQHLAQQHVFESYQITKKESIQEGIQLGKLLAKAYEVLDDDKVNAREVLGPAIFAVEDHFKNIKSPNSHFLSWCDIFNDHKIHLSSNSSSSTLLKEQREHLFCCLLENERYLQHSYKNVLIDKFILICNQMVERQFDGKEETKNELSELLKQELSHCYVAIEYEIDTFGYRFNALQKPIYFFQLTFGDLLEECFFNTIENKEVGRTTNIEEETKEKFSRCNVTTLLVKNYSKWFIPFHMDNNHIVALIVDFDETRIYPYDPVICDDSIHSMNLFSKYITLTLRWLYWLNNTTFTKRDVTSSTITNKQEIKIVPCLHWPHINENHDYDNRQDSGVAICCLAWHLWYHLPPMYDSKFISQFRYFVSCVFLPFPTKQDCDLLKLVDNPNETL